MTHRDVKFRFCWDQTLWLYNMNICSTAALSYFCLHHVVTIQNHNKLKHWDTNVSLQHRLTRLIILCQHIQVLLLYAGFCYPSFPAAIIVAFNLIVEGFTIRGRVKQSEKTLYNCCSFTVYCRVNTVFCCHDWNFNPHVNMSEHREVTVVHQFIMHTCILTFADWQ